MVMRDTKINHSIQIEAMDGDSSRKLSLKVDANWELLDDLVYSIYNDADAISECRKDPKAYLQKFGVYIDGPGADAQFLHLPDENQVRSLTQGRQPLVDPGQAIEPRRGAALGVVEALVAVTVAVV